MMIDQNPQLYYHVLSYAIVFGLEKKWARKFQGIMVENPAWCDGPAGSLGDAMVLGAMIGSLQSSVARNLYAQAASTPRAHPSSFGGGGFVGGGFGGGGGGAWYKKGRRSAAVSEKKNLQLALSETGIDRTPPHVLYCRLVQP
jgi:hypothetical protein